MEFELNEFFSTETCYEERDKRMAFTKEKKDELLRKFQPTELNH